MLVHDTRGRWWCYGRRGWTVPPEFHPILLLCDRLQQKGSLTEALLSEHLWVYVRKVLFPKKIYCYQINECWLNIICKGSQYTVALDKNTDIEHSKWLMRRHLYDEWWHWQGGTWVPKTYTKAWKTRVGLRENRSNVF